jgi:hypothetical protein
MEGKVNNPLPQFALRHFLWIPDDCFFFRQQEGVVIAGLPHYKILE